MLNTFTDNFNKFSIIWSERVQKRSVPRLTHDSAHFLNFYEEEYVDFEQYEAKPTYIIKYTNDLLELPRAKTGGPQSIK